MYCKLIQSQTILLKCQEAKGENNSTCSVCQEWCCVPLCWHRSGCLIKNLIPLAVLRTLVFLAQSALNNKKRLTIASAVELAISLSVTCLHCDVTESY